MNAYTENKDKKFNLRINVMKTTYVGLSRTLACITYKNITFKKKIQDKESHIFFQNKISSRSPINAASKSEVWVFLESKLLVGLHLKNFFKDVSIIFHNIFKNTRAIELKILKCHENVNFTISRYFSSFSCISTYNVDE